MGVGRATGEGEGTDHGMGAAGVAGVAGAAGSGGSAGVTRVNGAGTLTGVAVRGVGTRAGLGT